MEVNLPLIAFGVFQMLMVIIMSLIGWSVGRITRSVDNVALQITSLQQTLFNDYLKITAFEIYRQETRSRLHELGDHVQQARTYMDLEMHQHRRKSDV